jgi:hypothetical protein
VVTVLKQETVSVLRVRQSIAVALPLVAAALLSGCGSSMTDMNFFPNRGSIFKTQDWGSAGKVTAPDLIASGPVTPEDEVDAAGRCGAQAAAPSEPAVGTVAGDLATQNAPSQTEVAVTPGGVALGMTECQVVAHAGQPGQVAIGTENNERKVVLTYASGPWPGIYTFAAGRLKVIDRVAQPEPAKPARKKSGAKPATASVR